MRTGKIFLRQAQKVTDLINSLIDWIYPPQCRICGELSDHVPFLCHSCHDKLLVFDDTPDSVAYHRDHPADQVKVLYLFNETLQTLIHEIKYLDASYIAGYFGEELGKYYKDSMISDVEMLIPVPLHSVRKRERTYNQSYYLAKGIATYWGVPVGKKYVKRVRNTGTQTALNKNDRQINIKDAFKVSLRNQIPKSVCIVDDVFTTGATTMELARKLKNEGVDKVHILCLATPIRELKETEIES